MRLFEASHGWLEHKGPLPKINHTYPILKKLDKVILYLKKFQNLHESRDTTFESC